MAFNAGEIVGKIKAEISEFKKGIDEVRKQTQSMTDNVKGKFNDMNKTLKGAEGELKKLSVTFAAVGAAGAYAMTQLAKASGEAAGVKGAFVNFFGKEAPAALEKLKAATKGTVSEVELMKNANQALLLGIDPTILPQMFEGAMRSAQASGRPVSLAIQDITIGIGRQSKLILDNLGILVDAEGANERYAKSLGKTADALTDAERKAAFTQATMQALAENAEKVGEVQENAAIKMQQATAAISNAMIRLGDAVAPIVAQVAEWITALADWFTGLNPIVQQVIGWILAAVTAFGLLAAPILGLIAMIPSITAGFAAISAASGAIITAFGWIIGIVAVLGAAIAAFTWAWQNNFMGIQEIVTGAFTYITGMIQGAIQYIIDIFYEFVRIGQELWREYGEEIKLIMFVVTTYLAVIWNIFKEIFITVFKVIGTVAVSTIKGVLMFIVGAAKFIAGIFTGNVQMMKDGARLFFGAFAEVGVGIINGVITAIEGLINSVISGINAMIRKLKKIPVIGAQFAGVSELDPVSLGRASNPFGDVAGSGVAFQLPSFEMGAGLNLPDVGSMFGGAGGSGDGGVPTPPGGGSGGGKDKEKTAEDYVNEINKDVSANVSALGQERSTLRSREDQLTGGIEKIDAELARQKKEGTSNSSITKQLQDKRAKLVAERSKVRTDLAAVEKKIARSDSDAGRELRADIKTELENERVQDEAGGVDDLIKAQQEHERELEEQKREREKRMKEAATQKTGSSISTTVSTPSVTSPSVGAALSGGDTFTGGMHFHNGAFEGALIASKDYIKELFDEAFKDMQAKLGV